MWGEGRASLKDFKNLKVWEKAHELTHEIYRISEYFPKRSYMA
jgi:hypothetical protein